MKDWFRFLFSFRGRLSRQQYWFYINLPILGSIALFLVLMTFFLDKEELSDLFKNDVLLFSALGLFCVALISLFSADVRRLHDIGRSGWWVFLFMGASSIFDWAGFFLRTVVMLMPGDIGENKYGPDPRPEWGAPGPEELRSEQDPPPSEPS